MHICEYVYISHVFSNAFCLFLEPEYVGTLFQFCVDNYSVHIIMVEIVIHYIVHRKLVVNPFYSSNETLPYRMCTCQCVEFCLTFADYMLLL